MASPNGYNNPAYNHQFDPAACDYEYVPDIDPDYDGDLSDGHEQIHLVHPSFRGEFSAESEVFDASDESNQSIIVEECNNRRVTLICEKSSKTEKNALRESVGNTNGAYYHDISMEGDDFRKLQPEREAPATSSRHQRRLDPPSNPVGNNFVGFPCDDDYRKRNHLVQETHPVPKQIHQRPQRQHRYEVIEDFQEEKRRLPQSVSRHRYAEITVDENGYPSMGREIEIEQDDKGYRIVNATTADGRRDYRQRPMQKPRAASPTYSPTFGPSKTYQRTVSPHPPEMDPSAKPIPVPNRAASTSAIEMTELSPPRDRGYGKQLREQFVRSPKRQPPIGASSPAELWEQMKSGKCGKMVQNRQTENGRNVTPRKTEKPLATQMFQVKGTSRTAEERNSRRNISYSPADPSSNFDANAKCGGSPYRATTTTDVGRSKTAIITPILQRKNRTGNEEEISNFRKMSHSFQSTGDLCIVGTFTGRKEAVSNGKGRIKRNRSVPNFAQSLAAEGKTKYIGDDRQRFQKSVRKLDYQYSPSKSDRFSPVDRSRMSLIDQRKMSWSNSGSDFQSSASGGLLIGAIIQIITSIASCAICFYLFSKLGRRYYLDFGILAGFVNFILGALGFRSQCWRWLPNRNYVSGYILLTTFSIITCAGFVFLITARPMSGDPILDMVGGGICGVSVLTIVLSITGLTMSGCCKSPPPDNRVNNI